MTDSERMQAILIRAMQGLPREAVQGSVVLHMNQWGCLKAIGCIRLPAPDTDLLPPVIIGEVGGIPIALDDSLGSAVVRISWVEQTRHALTHGEETR